MWIGPLWHRPFVEKLGRLCRPLWERSLRNRKALATQLQIQTAGVRARQWTDEAGKQRRMTKDGHEHWIDNDGPERWVDWGGTEWVLLPIGVPLSGDAE